MYRAVLLYVAACRGPAPAAEGPPRVVSLHDATTELVVALGAADRLVGVDEPVDVAPAAAAAVARLPRVGDLESILAVHPTLVVGMQITLAKDPALVARLRDAGIAVYLGDPRTLDDVFGWLRGVGARVGAAAAADALASRMVADAGAAAPVATAPRRVFVYDCCDPPFTAAGNTVLGDLIARAGGRNLFGDVAAAWTHVSWEAVVARQPELIVVDAYAYAGQGDVADKIRAVHAIAGLAAVPTVILPLRDALGGIHSVEGLALLRGAIRGLP